MLFSVIAQIWTHPANRGRRLSALTKSICWQLYKRLTGRKVRIDVNGLVLICYPDSSSASGALYFGGQPDWAEMAFMRRYLRPGDAFVDVGANVGVYTLFARSLVGVDGYIVAIEPGEKQYLRLQENIYRNNLSNVELIHGAASDHEGKDSFMISEDDSNDHLLRVSEKSGIRVEVNSIVLDNLFCKRSYALAKMDIEGAEPLAFRGAQKSLRSANPPVWLCELAGYSKFYGMRSDELIGWMKSLGFVTAIAVDDSDRLWLTERPWELNRKNVFFVAQEHDYLLQSGAAPRKLYYVPNAGGR